MKSSIVSFVNRVFLRAGFRVSKVSRFVDPVAPFDLQSLAVRAFLLDQSANFYFVQVGSDRGLGDGFLQRIVKQYKLEGCFIEEPLELLEREFGHRDVSLLSIVAGGSPDDVVSLAFRAGIRPMIVTYEWTEMPIERRQALKLRLLDAGYRFIDSGADTVCLKVADDNSNN